MLLVAGELIYAVATMFHPDAADPIAALALYAGDRWWGLVHAWQFAGSVTATLGLLALVRGLDITSGLRGLANQFATATAVAALALNGALYAVDGVALKESVDSWASGPVAAQLGLLTVVQGVRGVEWGLRSYVDFTTGLTLVLIAVVIVSTGRVPRGIGWLMGVTGVAYLAQGAGYGGGYTALSEHFVLASTGYEFLAVVWTLWLLVVVWRMKEPR